MLVTKDIRPPLETMDKARDEMSVTIRNTQLASQSTLFVTAGSTSRTESRERDLEKSSNSRAPSEDDEALVSLQQRRT